MTDGPLDGTPRPAEGPGQVPGPEERGPSGPAGTGREGTGPPRFESQRVNPLHLIHKWSIEHPYVVLAFYFAAVVLAVLVVNFRMPRRFAPYVPSPMVGVVTMMPGLSAQEMELYVSKPVEEQ